MRTFRLTAVTSAQLPHAHTLQPTMSRRASWFSLLKRSQAASSAFTDSDGRQTQISPASGVRTSRSQTDISEIRQAQSSPCEADVALDSLAQVDQLPSEYIGYRFKKIRRRSLLSLRSSRSLRPVAAAGETHWTTELDGSSFKHAPLSTSPTAPAHRPMRASSSTRAARAYDELTSRMGSVEFRHSMSAESAVGAELQLSQTYMWLDRARDAGSSYRSFSHKKSPVFTAEDVQSHEPFYDSAVADCFVFAQSGNLRGDDVFCEKHTVDFESNLAAPKGWTLDQSKSQPVVKPTRSSSTKRTESKSRVSPRNRNESPPVKVALASTQASLSVPVTATILTLRRGVSAPSLLRLSRSSPAASEATASSRTPTVESHVSPRIQHPYLLSPAASEGFEGSSSSRRSSASSMRLRRHRLSPPISLAPSFPPPPIPTSSCASSASADTFVSLSDDSEAHEDARLFLALTPPTTLLAAESLPGS